MMADRRSRHGLAVLKARVKVRGFSAIDLRTAAAQALVQWKAELLRDLGGEANVSAQRMTLVEMVVRTKLYIDHIDAWLMEQDCLVNRRKRSLLPVVKERQGLVDSLSRMLAQLGLERQQKPVKSLREYVAEKYGDGKVPVNGQGEEEDVSESGASPTDEANVKEAEGANDAK